MAERKAVNKYYPPEWSPEKGSINKYVGQHPLRQRARKLGEGILVVRFEMPYNVWCLSCNHMIGKGTRFNAEKKQIGSYFSTKIFNFKMKCPNCKSFIEVETDPKIADYVMKTGLKQRTETWDPADSQSEHLMSDAETQKLREDVFARIEHFKDDERLSELEIPEVERLLEIKDRRSEHDYDTNRLARSIFRKERKKYEALELEAEKRGLGIALLPESPDDAIQVARIEFKESSELEESKKTYTQLKKKVASESVFKGHSKSDRKKRRLISKTMQHGVDLSLFKRRKE